MIASLISRVLSIFLRKNVRISIEISLNFVPKSPIDNIPTLFQLMAWRRPGDKPLSEAMMVSLLTHKCVARPQWVIRCSHWSFENVKNSHPTLSNGSHCWSMPGLNVNHVKGSHGVSNHKKLNSTQLVMQKKYPSNDSTISYHGCRVHITNMTSALLFTCSFTCLD